MGSKRPRRVNTCLFCRSKKLKCDRKSPCSTCVKYKNPNCEYPNINIIRLEEDNEHLVRRLSLLKGQIKTLEQFIEQKDNQTDDLTPSGLDSLPFSLSETDISNSSATISGPMSTTMSISNSENSVSASSENSDSTHDSIEECGNDEGPEEEYTIETICKIDQDKSCSDMLRNVLPGTVNLYQLYDPVLYEGRIRKYSPPMTWLSFFHCDKFMRITRKVTFNDLSLDNKLLFFNQLADAGCDHQLEKMFIIKYHDDEGYEDFKALNDVFDDELSNNRKIILLNSISFQDSFSDKKLQNFEKFNLISKIHFILPKYEVIDLLVNRFFKIIYPFIPIVDENDFRNNIERILAHKLKIKEKIDLTYIGILLIMLRLSYLSIFSLVKDQDNELYETPENLAIIKQNPIKLDAIEVAQECSKYFNLLSYNDLRILQLGLFLRNYEIFGPEYGLGAKSNETYSFDIVLNRLANNLGLFNEFNFSNDNAKLANLKRKISVYIYSNNSIVSGVVSSNFISHSINIKLPPYDINNSNNRSPEVENATIKLLNICLGGKRIVKTCNEFFEKFNFNDTTNKKNQFNHLINTILVEDVKDLQHNSRYKVISNTFILQFKVTVQVLNLSVLFHIFNGIQEPAIRTTFLDRLIFYIFKKTIPIITIIFRKKNDLKNVNDLIYIPNLLHLLHRIFIILLSLMIRLKLLNIKLVTENKMDQFYRLNLQLIDLINLSFTKLLKVIYNLSNRYYYAWRTFKIQNYFLRCINLLDLPSIFESELHNDDDYFGVNEQLLESWICMVVNFTKDQTI